MSKSGKQFNRRLFIQSGVSATMAAGAGLAARASEIQNAESLDPKKIKNYQPNMTYRRLPNTDIYLSVLCMGGLVNEPGVHAYAIDNGVNIIHIADNYLGGRSIVDVGEVMKTRRDKVYICLKDNFFSKRDYETGDFKKLDEKLKVLRTEYIDFLMFNIHDGNEVKQELYREAFEKLKATGKVRYAGLTSHGDVKNATAAGIEMGWFTLVNPALNQSNLDALDKELRDAQDRKIGVMPMKTMRGIDGRDNELAFLKKLLRNPAIITINKGIGSYDMFDQYRKAAGETLTGAEDHRLYRYAQSNRASVCMMCDECKTYCPERIEISTVIRCKDYYLEQCADRATAWETYRSLPEEKRWSDACGDCTVCEKACPKGIDIVERLRNARMVFA